MKFPISLPSGKLLDLDRCIALTPIEASTGWELSMSGLMQPLSLDNQDATALKKILDRVHLLPESAIDVFNLQADDQRGSTYGWQYLVARPHPWRKQLYLKGTKLLASVIWQDSIVNRLSREEASENWDLSIDVIDEVMYYCETHQSLIEIEAKEEKYRIQAQGAM